MTTLSLSSALKEVVQRLLPVTTSCICTSRREMQGNA